MARLTPLWLRLPAIASRLRETPSVMVATDYDGTLTPIVGRPEEAGLPPRTRRALERLARLPRLSVAVLSGRSLDDLQACLGLGGIYLSGASGLETLEPAGRRRVHLPPGEGLPEALRAALEEWCARFPGAWIEDKRVSFAAHYRAVPERFQAAFGAGVRRRFRPHRDRATLVHGKKVFEVMPPVRWNKASALERWLRTRRGALAFYFGDDTNDEPVFRRLRRDGGITVAVGRPGSRAEYLLGSPDEVVWFLEWLAREWGARLGGDDRA
jgi:trehalose-phosphatase